MRRVKILDAECLRDYVTHMAGKTGYFHQISDTEYASGALIEVEGCIGWYEVKEFAFIDPPEQVMTLRNQFAGMAMQGFLASLSPETEPVEIKTAIAEHCFQIADAMLAESEKKS